MPLTKAKKHEVVTEVGQEVAKAQGVVFMTFDGLTMPEVNDLRAKLFSAGVAMRVMPKRLLRIVLKDQKLEFDPMAQVGQIAVVWGADAVTPAKVLHDFAKKNQHMKLVAGVLEGNVLSTEQVLALAKLPSREQLLGQLVGVLAGPIRGFASVLNGVQRQTVYVLTAIKDQKQSNS